MGQPGVGTDVRSSEPGRFRMLGSGSIVEPGCFRPLVIVWRTGETPAPRFYLAGRNACPTWLPAVGRPGKRTVQHEAAVPLHAGDAVHVMELVVLDVVLGDRDAAQAEHAITKIRAPVVRDRPAAAEVELAGDREGVARRANQEILPGERTRV